MKLAAETIKLTERVNVHGLRRAFIRDMADQLLPQAGGHDHTALINGITSDYNDGLDEDLHSIQRAAPIMNYAREPIWDTDRPFKTPRLSEERLDTECGELGLDASLQNDLVAGGVSLRANAKTTWAE